MSVIHIVKDGSVVSDISDRVVRMEDAGALYALFDTMNRKGSEEKTDQITLN